MLIDAGALTYAFVLIMHVYMPGDDVSICLSKLLAVLAKQTPVAASNESKS
jgi:hypothetical protein